MPSEADSQSSHCEMEKKLKIVLYRSDFFPSTASNRRSVEDESNSASGSGDSSHESPTKYRRRNCGICKGCAKEDCGKCPSCLRFISNVYKKRKEKCSERMCRRPTLPKTARCLICQSSTQLTFDISFYPTSSTFVSLAECGLCGKVVHPVCLFRRFNLSAEKPCHFYEHILNAWDCVFCTLGVEVDSLFFEPKNLRKSADLKPDFDDKLSRSKAIVRLNPIAPELLKPVAVKISRSSEELDKTTTEQPDYSNLEPQNFSTTDPPNDSNTEPSIYFSTEPLNESAEIEPLHSESISSLRCYVCAKNDLSDSLFTCTECTKTCHDVCLYDRHREDPRYVAGIRNCVDPRFWECPFCLRKRGIREGNWFRHGVLWNSTRSTTVKEKTIEMFNKDTGNIVVSHLTIFNEEISDYCASALSYLPRFEDVSAAETYDGDGGGDRVSSVKNMEITETNYEVLGRGANDGDVVTEVSCVVGRNISNGELASVLSRDANVNVEPLKVLNLSPMISFKCDYCPYTLIFLSEEALGRHVTFQHPACGHCPGLLPFRDIENILSHFKIQHKNLKRCKILIAEQTLTLAMNASVHG